MFTMYLVRSTDCGDGRIPSITEESFTLAPQPPLPKPPPPNPFPPPLPPPPVDGCQYSCKDTRHEFDAPFTDPTDVQSFCSDGGPNSVPIAHDPATGEPIFMCDFGTQCSTLECGPRTVSQVEESICSDVCRPTVANGVQFTGYSNNGICEDGGDAIAHAWYSEPTSDVFATWLNTGYVRTTACGYGTHCTTKRIVFLLRSPFRMRPGALRHRLHRLWPETSKGKEFDIRYN